jgi:hypothetical protein
MPKADDGAVGLKRLRSGYRSALTRAGDTTLNCETVDRST